MDRVYAVYNRIRRLGSQCTRGTISDDDRRLQETFHSTRISRLGIHLDRRIPRPDLLCGTEMGQENNAGLHQYLLVDWRYQCELYPGLWC
jgi:hypothetical protein